MKKAWLGRVSIKWILPPLLVVPVLAFALALTLLAYTSARRTADDLAGQNMQQIHSRIEEHLTRLLDLPPATCELTKRMLETGQVALDDPDRSRVPIFEVLNVFPAVNSIALGKATGEAMWVIHYLGEEGYEFAVQRSAEERMREYPLDDSGEIAGDEVGEYEFDATGRPWYVAAVQAEGPTWGEVYIWVRRGKGETLGLSYVEPRWDTDGSVLGVVSCDLTLASVSAFLGRLQVGKTGKAFIMESDGSLVANSEGFESMQNGLDRLPATAAPDAWVAEAARELESRFGRPLEVSRTERVETVIDGEPMQMVVSPYSNRRNLEWLIVTLVPDRDFLAGVRATRTRTIALAGVAVLLMVVIGIATAVMMTRPILKLVSHARSITDGDLDDRLELDNNLEMVQLSTAINDMVDDIQQRDLLQNTLESLTHPFYVVDAENYSIVIKNSAAEALSRSGAATCYALTHKAEAPCGGDDHPCPLQMVKATGEPAVVEHIHYGPDGDRFYAEVHGYPIFDAEGRVVQMIEYSLDITERKRMEDDLLEARIAADAANQAKSEFLSSMSHELRTPLNGVLGYVQVLQRDRTLTPRQRQSLESIKNCGEHLLSLINDVLDLSKIEAGRMEIEPAPCDFSHLITSVADIIRQRAEGKGLELTVDVEPQVPRGIMADEQKLRQVLVNLLGNAVKFTDKGHIGLSVSEQGGKTLTIEVSDTGMGISEEHLESIFDPFAQSEGGKTAGGTGLGLAISVRMVAGMGGNLTVDSELGVGSTFTITLPLTEVEDEDLVAVQSTGLGGDNPDLVLADDQDVLVLVADDREANRDVLVQLLEAAGFRTVQAVNGREALDRMHEHSPDIVLMDVRMPEMDGVTAVGILRKDAGLRDTVVIAVSASVFPDSAQRFRDAGFDDFLGKPLAAGELFGKLREHAGVVFADIADIETPQEAQAVDAGALTPEEAADLVARIRGAAAMGDVSALTELASDLEASGGAPGAYAGRIGELAGMFDFTGLNELADEIESSSSDGE